MKLITLLESKQTEDLGKNILKGKGISENDIEKIVNNFKNGDTSQNQKNIPIMCFFYDSNISINQIISEINDFNVLMDNKRITTENFGKKGLTIKYNGTNGGIIEKTYTSNDWLSFTELIHGQLEIFNRSREKSSEYEVTKYDEEKSANLPIFMKGDKINVYEAKGKKDCINYTHSLTNRSYTFCIGKTEPTQNAYNSYRNTRSAKFYYIVDLNKMDKPNDPLHMVVLQTNLLPSKSITLTDANNSSGNIAEYGTDVDGYLKYLESKGIDTDEFEYSELTEIEKHTNRLVNQPIDDLKILLNLDNPSNQNYKKPDLEIESDLENYYLGQYIDRGHTLTDDQFNYFLDVNNR